MGVIGIGEGMEVDVDCTQVVLTASGVSMHLGVDVIGFMMSTVGFYANLFTFCNTDESCKND